MSCVLSVMRFHSFYYEISWWDVTIFVRDAFCCTILAVCFLLHNFVRGILMRCHAFLGRCELCVWVFMLVFNCDFRMFAFLGLSQYFDQFFSFRLLFLRVDCERTRRSFLATVFNGASVFNGDISRWNVTKVATMESSKWIIVILGCSLGFGLMVMM